MKRALSTFIIALVCSLLSAFATAYFVSSHWQKGLMLFLGGRSGDYLITAAKIREGKTDDLLKWLEWNAQVEFLQQYHAKNNQWTFEFSHQILDAYSRRYGLSLAEPFKNIEPPNKPFSEEALIQYMNAPVPNEWPDWFKDINATNQNIGSK